MTESRYLSDLVFQLVLIQLHAVLSKQTEASSLVLKTLTRATHSKDNKVLSQWEGRTSSGFTAKTSATRQKADSATKQAV